MSHFIDIMLWGTGGPLMYVALALLAVAVPFLYLAKQWGDAIDVIPLNYVAEERYRPAYRAPAAPVSTGPIYAMSASSAYATIPRIVPVYVQHLDRLPSAR